MKLLITSANKIQFFISGSTGFLGKELINYLIKCDIVPIVVKFPNRDNHEIYSLEKRGVIKIVDIDENIYKSKNAHYFKSNFNKVFLHFAGCAEQDKCEKNYKLAYQSNVKLTCDIIQFSKINKINKIIYPSTGLVYGDRLKYPAKETDKTLPNSVYCATKLISENILIQLGKVYNISVLIARLSNVYGINSKSNTIIGKILKNFHKKTVYLNTFYPVRDFIHIDDVVEGIIRLSKLKTTNKQLIINLSTAKGCSIFDAVLIFKQLKNIKIIAGREKIYTYLVLNNNKLYSTIKWKPRIRFKQGLTSIIESLQ